MGARARRPSRERGHLKAEPRGPSRLWKAGLLAFGVTWLAALVRWWPLTQFPVWGSDQGEYAALLEANIATGGLLPATYTGWGGGYPDFKGMYVVAGAFSQISGLDPFLALSLVIPAAASLTAPLAFVVALRLSGSLRASTAAGALVAVAMPEAFAGSHAMPGALGGMLALAALAALVHTAREPLARLVVVAFVLALVPTHHLSAFLAGAMLAAAALFEARTGPADVQRSRIVDTALLGASLLVLLSSFFWAAGAPHFRAGVLDNTSPAIARFLPGVALLAVVALVVLSMYFEALPRRQDRRVAIFDENATLRRFALAIACTAAAAAYVATVGVPGTTAVVSPGVVLPFLPLGIALAAVVAGPGRLAPVRGASMPLAACLGVALSGVIGALALPTILIPYRHLQYFVDAASPLAAVAIVFAARAVALHGLPGRRELQRALSAGLVVALVAGVSLSTYPSKEALVGFQEGTAPAETAGVLWLSWFVPTTLVATDHRLSSVVYGFAHHDATWEAGGPILVGDAALGVPALDSVKSPRGASGVGVVLLSHDIVGGAALTQWDPTVPLSGAALAKFDNAPFVRAFDNGDAVAYWVAR